MPSEFPGSPKLLKGALVVYKSHTPGEKAKVIAFQYNPVQVSRSLAHSRAQTGTSTSASRGQAQEDVLRVEGPPTETINLSVILDAADHLEEPELNLSVVQNGLHPVLATLEMLLYPNKSQVLQNQNQADRGEVQLNPPNLPLTLLVWGKSRVVPVLITNFSVTEEVFDTILNPIRAKVELGFKVLNYVDLPENSAGRDIYISYQDQKENLANKHQSGLQEFLIKGLLPG